jgi:hypothetical protein
MLALGTDHLTWRGGYGFLFRSEIFFHFTKCIIKYVLNTRVIVYLLQYLVSVIIISETMKTMQHQEVDSECFW